MARIRKGNEMECYACGAVLGRESHCPVCGADVKLYKKLIHTSNLCYNEGLDRARVRDLSGAAESLRRSLKFYKMNIPARNLLGLVYFEMGETVDALSEWVISRSLSPEDHVAEKYLQAVQSNGNRLDSLNQTIKKYNQALLYCRQGSKDLAIIQLKKVLALNPRLVKGHQLLALLYMQEGKYDLAKKCLRNAGRIDANNTTTLRYLREVNIQLHGELPSRKNSRKEKEKEELVAYQSGNETIIHPASFKDNTTFTTVLNIVVGVVVGVLITCFLVVPGVRQKAVSDSSKALRESNETISTKNQTIKSLEGQIEDLNAQMDQVESDKEANASVLAAYEQVLVAYEAFTEADYERAGSALESVDPELLAGSTSEIYQDISTQINDKYKEILYQEGSRAYQSGRYEEAVEKLQKVVDMDEAYGDGDAVYYLAQSCRQAGQNDQAVTYYQKIIELRPGTERAENAKKSLEELGQGVSSQDE